MEKEKIDSWLSRYQEYIQVLPIFLLALGCGIDSGALMTLAVAGYLLIGYLYHEKIGFSLLKSRLFLFSLGALAFWLLCLWIPTLWTGGKYSLLWKYAGRALPMLLVCLLGEKQKYFYPAIWLGLMLSVGWYAGEDILLYPRFTLEHRLVGTFTSPNGLAGVLCMLLPAVVFGIIRYGRQYKKIGVLAILFCLLGLGMLVLTGSRNGFLTTMAVVIVLFYFLWRTKNKFFLKLGAVLVVLGLGAGLILAPQMISQRATCDLQKDGRVWLFQVAIDMYEKHPNTGIGLGNWQHVYHTQYERPNREKNVASPHNIYLHTLSESGRIGLFGLLALFFFQFSVLCRSGFINKRDGQYVLRWTVCNFLIMITTVVFCSMDYAFFDRHFAHLFWFYWGLAIYEIYYRNKELLR